MAVINILAIVKYIDLNIKRRRRLVLDECVAYF